MIHTVLIEQEQPCSSREAKELLREAVRSGNWWLILSLPVAWPICLKIEQSYYQGSKDHFFTLPSEDGSSIIVLAHKSKMTSKNLHEILSMVKDLEPITEKELEKRDILVLGCSAKEVGEFYTGKLHLWLYGASQN